MRGTLLVAALLGGAITARAEIKITIDRNTGAAATGQFKFKSVPSPIKDDAAAKAAVTIVAGAADPNSAPIRALTDGALPASEDEPGSNFFFKAGTWGGRLRMDLGSAIDIAQIHTYSWHPDTRGPQVYKVYGSDGGSANFNALPASKLDPITCGWTLIAFVDTRSNNGDDGGQYGVSISDTAGTLGKFRYLLFDCFEAESDDPWGHTFYSEVDVIAGGNLPKNISFSFAQDWGVAKW